ncbi:MAG: DUF499 domain-containing protein [Methanotrichaceae archaeon]|nr:DUF499 domain-containing protein [Methanotrichaceae archaeon]
MALVPWHKAADPREDLREGKPLDAAEFAVHLDQVRDRKAPTDYRDPERFFDRTYLTNNLTDLAAQAVRRLSGEKTETSAVFNMATQFGGGKTHALTLLYHLASNGAAADRWRGVQKILDRAGIDSVPGAAVAVFVGTEFDSLTGRGGEGEPLRKTPWGEIAFQLGGAEAFSKVEAHEKEGIAPGGDVIQKFLPQDAPCLILIDELMNYVSRYRKTGLSNQVYDFLQNLSVTISGMDKAVLVVSVPKSETEMTEEDYSDYVRFKKLLDRVGKPMIVSAESDTSEIIRRRLFQWNGQSLTPEGKVVLSRDAIQTCKKYAEWVRVNRHQLPGWFPIDHAQQSFEATYPFHPIVLSVFERKWQALPKFQRTRGVLRLLALWVSKAFQENYKGAHPDALIGLGTAPLDDPLFRAAVFEQLGEDRLEGAVTTDIIGKVDSHAVQMDREANPAIKRARLHRKVATSIFFESNGGQTHGTDATLPEIRLSVAEPDLDIGNVETVLETLSDKCYFLSVLAASYRFSLLPNLNKIIADKKAVIDKPSMDEHVRKAIERTFHENNGLKTVIFPAKSSDIPDQPALTLIVLSPELARHNKATIDLIESMTREYGTSARTYKSALIWAMADSDATLANEARSVLAWQRVQDEADQHHLDERQMQEVSQKISKAERDLREAVWRSYRNLALLGKDNRMLLIDLGLIHSSAARSLIALYLLNLKQKDLLSDTVSPNFLVKNWPPAFKDWPTAAVRDAFYASPQFPRLLKSEAVKDVISKGVINGIFAYAGKSVDGEYNPVCSKRELAPQDVEISHDMFIVKEPIQLSTPTPGSIVLSPGKVNVKPGERVNFTAQILDKSGKEIQVDRLGWSTVGGTVDDQGSLGVFQAGQEEGTFSVVASVGSIKGSATVNIASEEYKLNRIVVSPTEAIISPGKSLTFSIKGYDELGIEVPVSDATAWAATGGTIDSKGNFKAGTEEGAFKVTSTVEDVNSSAIVIVKKLSFCWSGDLPHLRWTQFYNRILMKFASRPGLKLEVSVEVPDASEEEIEETKVALRELGLSDNIEVK